MRLIAQNALRKNEPFYRRPSAMWRSASATRNGFKILLFESAYRPQVQNALRKNEPFYRRPSAMWRSASATRNGFKILLFESAYRPQVQNALRKNEPFYRLPSAFGQYPTKSPASLRRCVLKKRSRQMAFGFWSILFGKPLK